MTSAFQEVTDIKGLPTYLEATSPANRRLYARLGDQDFGEPLQLPAGPPIFPMWRSVGGGTA